MKKRIRLWINGLLLMALITGCTLAQPELAGTAGGDTFCGFWLIYDRWENDDHHVFDVDSDAEQMLLRYTLPAGDGAAETAQTSKAGSSVGDVAMNLHYKDEGEEIEIKGTIYLLDEEDPSLKEYGYREIWLYGDVLQSFRDSYIQPPEGMSREDMLKPGETVIVYIPQEQIDKHGRELTQMAEKAGGHLLLKSESPRRLRITPVYQRPDGTVYAENGGIHFILGTDGVSHTRSVEQTQTVNGKTTKRKVTATISAQWVDALKTVRLVEMNAQNEAVRSREVTIDDMQSWAKQEKPYALGEGSAYLIVEETYETKLQNSYIKRTIYSPPKAGDFTKPMHTFRFPLENGLTGAVSMHIAF